MRVSGSCVDDIALPVVNEGCNGKEERMALGCLVVPRKLGRSIARDGQIGIVHRLRVSMSIFAPHRLSLLPYAATPVLLRLYRTTLPAVVRP